MIAGLTRYSNKSHLARAVLEATAFQTREVVEAMEKDSGVPLSVLRTDGGMVGNELLMQFQADILDRTVVRPAVRETTALGAAYAAGLATGFYASVEDLRAQWSVDRAWKPQMDAGAAGADVRLLEEGGHAVVRLAGGIDAKGSVGRVHGHHGADPAGERRGGQRAAPEIQGRRLRVDGHYHGVGHGRDGRRVYRLRLRE